MGSIKRVRCHAVFRSICAYLQLENEGRKLHSGARTIKHCKAPEDGSPKPQSIIASSARIRTPSTTFHRVCNCSGFSSSIGAKHTNHTCSSNEPSKHNQPIPQIFIWLYCLWHAWKICFASSLYAIASCDANGSISKARSLAEECQSVRQRDAHLILSQTFVHSRRKFTPDASRTILSSTEWGVRRRQANIRHYQYRLYLY